MDARHSAWSERPGSLSISTEPRRFHPRKASAGRSSLANSARFCFLRRLPLQTRRRTNPILLGENNGIWTAMNGSPALRNAAGTAWDMGVRGAMMGGERRALSSMRAVQGIQHNQTRRIKCEGCGRMRGMTTRASSPSSLQSRGAGTAKHQYGEHHQSCSTNSRNANHLLFRTLVPENLLIFCSKPMAHRARETPDRTPDHL